MMVIGITGGIASGKTTIARMLAQRGIEHINADALVHELLLKDKKTLASLAKIFPKAVHNNTIDRKVLGEIVGKDEAALQKLTEIDRMAKGVMLGDAWLEISRLCFGLARIKARTR